MGCVGTCILLILREVLYRLICSEGCCNLLFYDLGACVPKFTGVGLLFVGWCLLRLRRFFGLGRCVHLNFCQNVFVGLVLRLHLYCVSGALVVKGM